MRWMFKFTGYEYTFRYKPGKLNCNADALSQNPADHPTEEAINDQLPRLKIMVLQAKIDPKASKEKKEEKSKTPNSSLPKPGPSGIQAPFRYGLAVKDDPLELLQGRPHRIWIIALLPAEHGRKRPELPKRT